MRKFVKATAAVSTLSISAAAYALPAQVPDIYYDKLPHRMEVWASNPGFCVHSAMNYAPVCKAP